jgi:hypothetical protein
MNRVIYVTEIRQDIETFIEEYINLVWRAIWRGI